MADYAPELKRFLRQQGCTFVRRGKGDHEPWQSPFTGTVFPVDHKILSRHTANGILNERMRIFTHRCVLLAPVLLAISQFPLAQAKPAGQQCSVLLQPYPSPFLALFKRDAPVYVARFRDPLPCSTHPESCKALGKGKKGVIDEVEFIENGWACVRPQSWVHASDFELLPFNQHPKLSDWLGTWRPIYFTGHPSDPYADGIFIVPAAAPGALRLFGQAANERTDRESYYEFYAPDSKPEGNMLLTRPGPERPTVMRILLFGKYMTVYAMNRPWSGAIYVELTPSRRRGCRNGRNHKMRVKAFPGGGQPSPSYTPKFCLSCRLTLTG